MASLEKPAISVWKESLLEAARTCNLPVGDLTMFVDTLDPKDLEHACQQVWLYVSHKLLTADMPLATHQALYVAVYSAWPRQRRGPPPMWLPDPAREPAHNVTRFLKQFKGDAEFEGARGAGGASDWQQLHALSVRDPERVLSEVLLTELALPLHRKPRRVLRLAPRPDDCRWLPGAALNIAWCALHTPRGGPSADSQPAVAWAEEGRPEVVHTLNRRQLRALALHVAACLKKRGLAPGDAVAVVLPLTPVSTAVYLGIVLSGCVVVSIADSFAAHEIEARLRIAGTKLVITQDVVMRGGKPLPLLPRVIEGAGAPPAVVILGAADSKDLINAFMTGSSAGQQGSGTTHAGLRACDVSWAAFMASAHPQESHAAACLPATSHPPGLHVASPGEATNILFSSGTTGEPKAIVWDHVIPLRAAVDGWAHQGIQAGERVCWPTSLGWMMGPWLIYAALLNGGCITLYNGAPLGRDFGLFVRSAGVHMLGLVPSIVKVWRHSGCMKGLSWPSLKAISSTGEASAPDDYHWLYATTGYRVPILEYIGGTELGGSYATGSLLQPASPCTFSTPSLGTQLVLMVPGPAATAIGLPLVESEGGPVGLSLHAVGAPPVAGEVALVAPSLGGAQRLLNKDHHKVYYEGMPTYAPTGRPLRRHGDELCRLPGGYYTALGRVDDTMNLGGIKVASVELERAVMEGVATVSEVAAVGVPTPGGGPEQLVLFVVLRPGQTTSATELTVACQAAIRGQLNPLFKVERVVVVGALPRNASNKLMRRTLRDELLAAQQPRSKL